MPTQQAQEIGTNTINEMLVKTLGDNFSRLGSSPIYKSAHTPSKIVIARISQRYNRTDSNYWYGTTPKDLERVNEFNVTHFAFVCANSGIVLIPTEIMLQEIKANNIHTTIKDGQIRHYHIQFYERGGSIYWNLKSRDKNVNAYYFKMK